MESRVIGKHLLVPIEDKMLAVYLVSQGFSFGYIESEEYGDIEWFDRMIYDEETGEERERTQEEIIKEIMECSKPIYMIYYIPINFVERKKGTYVGVAKYGIGSTVYVNTTTSSDSIFAAIRKGTVIAVDIREGVLVDERFDIKERRCGHFNHEYKKEEHKRHITYKVAFWGEMADNGFVPMGVFSEEELTSDLDKLINELKNRIK